MFFKKILVNNFRSLENIDLNLYKKKNVIFGLNGQGKTNLLEALYILINRRSFRKNNNDIIKYGKDFCKVEGIIEIDDIENRITFEINRDRRIFLRDEKKDKKRLKINTFFLSGDVLFYFKNFSFYRRNLIDKICYFFYGDQFLHVHKMWIKSKINFRKTQESKEKTIFKDMELRYKKIVDKFRVELIENIRESFEDIKKSINLPDITIKIIRDERDDINFFRNNRRDLSLGELKSLIFAIYISAIKQLKEKNNILLIDDFNSEWDNKRIEDALNILEDINNQSIVMINQEGPRADFKIEKGELFKL